MNKLQSFLLALGMLAFAAGIAGVCHAQQISGTPVRHQTGTWTPTDNSGAALSFTAVSAAYTVIDNMVFAYGTLTYPSTVNGSNNSITGLPFTVANAEYARQCFITYTTIATAVHAIATKNGVAVSFSTSAGVTVLNSALSLGQVTFECVYPLT